MHDSALLGIPIPDSSDVADIPTHLDNIVDEMEVRTNLVFASTAARDAALPSPQQGVQCYTEADDYTWVYSGSAWVRVATYTSTWPGPWSQPWGVLTDTNSAKCANTYSTGQVLSSQTAVNINGTDFTINWPAGRLIMLHVSFTLSANSTNTYGIQCGFEWWDSTAGSQLRKLPGMSTPAASFFTGWSGSGVTVPSVSGSRTWRIRGWSVPVAANEYTLISNASASLNICLTDVGPSS